MVAESTAVRENNQQELTEFAELMHDVAELPADQREKVTYFAQGVIAASASRKVAVVNE
jgi:hypothetical protein